MKRKRVKMFLSFFSKWKSINCQFKCSILAYSKLYNETAINNTLIGSSENITPLFISENMEKILKKSDVIWCIFIPNSNNVKIDSNEKKKHSHSFILMCALIASCICCSICWIILPIFHELVVARYFAIFSSIDFTM